MKWSSLDMWANEEIKLSVPEQWKQYKDTPYYVSDQGRVKRTYKNGKISYLKPATRMSKNKPCKSVRVKIYDRYVTLNKLVWETFKGPVPDGYTVMNKRGYSTMNDLYSLELVSIHDINKHSTRPSSKKVIDLTTGWVYPSIRDLARRLNRNKTTVNNWCLHKYRKTVNRYEYYDENKKYYGLVLKFIREGDKRK